MKRHAVIMSIKVEHSDLKIARFLKVARFFVYKVKKGLKAYGLKTNLWPPSSPDLNPLDYHLWGVIERLISIPITPNSL